MAPLFTGCDYNHWLIVMDKPGGEGAIKQQMINCYVQTLAKVLGSKERQKRRFTMSPAIDTLDSTVKLTRRRQTSLKVDGLPGILFVLPYSFIDPEYKDYGAELFVKGGIVLKIPRKAEKGGSCSFENKGKAEVQ